LKIQFENEEEACFWVMGLGARVEVLEPEALREKVIAELGAAIERARTRAAASPAAEF
jgi:predicted DNA-binding transcriptional regulator YafY